MRSDKKTPLKSDKKAPPKVQKKGTIGYNKKSALLEDAITQMNAGKYGRASSALKDLLALDPLNAEARRLFATLHLRLGSLMSARTAFESLAREAIERQDYWLAESLLREYLTAGPRCVPFLEMLGRVYEEKGDVMAAVAEYGKAVEVLLEDPDAENPNRASELFARIRSVAPGSPVAFRFAAMFDTVTGQILQATPQPAVVDSASESPQAAGVSDSPADSASAVAMPWEQMEPAPTNAPLEQELPVPVAGHSTETMDSVLPLTSVQAVTEVERQDGPLDQASATQAADSSAKSESQFGTEAAALPVASMVDSVQVADQSEPPVVDLAPASTGEAELSSPLVVKVPQPTIEVLAQVSSQPIAETPTTPAPMPWDQVEDVAVVIPPSIDSSPSITVEVAPALSWEAELPSLSVPESASPTMEVLPQTSSQPIVETPTTPAPMPWDQVEDVAVVIPPSIDSSPSITVEVAPALSWEAELPSLSVPESASPTMEVLPQTSSQPMVEVPTTPAPMPWGQVEEVATVILPPPASQGPITPEVAPVLSGEAELPPPPVIGTDSPTIEVLTQACNHPIAEAPATPAPMPWDQVEETTSAVPPIAELKVDFEAVEADKAIEPAATNHVADSGSPTQPPASSAASEITSSGLSWEDILAAVTAMQSSPAPAPTLSSVGNEPSSDSVVSDEPAAAIMAPPDHVETESFLFEAPASDTFVGQVSEAPLLSAPMPWEQIEVDDVAIPRQEPEPEFGPASSDSGGGAQDATLVMPGVQETPETVAAAGALTEGSVAESSVPIEATPTSEFRILSPDAPIEARKYPIHIPAEAYEPVDESAQDAVPELEPPVGFTINEPAERPLRLAGSDSIAATASDEPSPVPVEPVTELAIATPSDVPPLALRGVGVQDIQAPVGESEPALPVEPAPLVDQPVAEVSIQGVMTPPADETAVEVSASSVGPLLMADQPVAALPPEAFVQDVPPASDPEMSAVVDQETSPTSEAEVLDVGVPLLRESVVPAVEASRTPALPVSEAVPAQTTFASIGVQVDESIQVVVESAQVAEGAPVAEVLEVPAEPAASADPRTTSPAHPAPSTPASGEGLRILWDDASSAPAPTTSTGNMLTRWLKKPAAVAPAEVSEASHPTTVPHEPPAPVAPLPVERQEAAPVVTDHPVDRSGSSKPVSLEEPAVCPKSSQAATGWAWRRLGRAVSSLIGAGVSTTRSLVVLVLALVGLTLILIAGAVGGIALMWMVFEEQPTIAYRNMTSVPQRTLEESGKNGYLLLLGFGAAATQDPVQAGMERRVAGDDRAFAHTCLTGEGSGSGSQQGASAEVMGKWAKTADPAAQMRLEATGVKSWVSQAEVSVSRYRQWLTKPFEDWGYGEPISPNCGLILYAHRLYVAEGFAQEVEAGVARLETDLTAWRTVLGLAKTMPVKMLASDALNDDIMVMGGLLLRPELDERLISRLAKLARPLDQAEQSIRWPMQSQFVLATKMLDETISQDRTDARPFYGSVAAALPLPKQRRFNAYAQYYEAAGKAAGEGRYADLPKQSQFVHAPPYGLGDLFVNPIESLVGIDPLPTWETYAGRVLETDARLRLASLQAWLRRTPAEQDLLTRIAKAGQGLYDPFTGFPMLVNTKKGVLYSVGRDSKDNEAQERFDVVVQIPQTAWVGGKRPADVSKIK